MSFSENNNTEDRHNPTNRAYTCLSSLSRRSSLTINRVLYTMKVMPLAETSLNAILSTTTLAQIDGGEHLLP